MVSSFRIFFATFFALVFVFFFFALHLGLFPFFYALVFVLFLQSSSLLAKNCEVDVEEKHESRT